MTAFKDHPALAPLPPKLRSLVATWLEEIARSTNNPTLDSVIEDFDTLIYGGLDQICSVSRVESQQILTWFENADVDLLDAAVVCMLDRRDAPREEPRRTFRGATPEQLRIIEEAQGEVGLDFRPFFPELTSWQADALIKGCVVVSEVQRQTGDRHFALRDLRQAIRQFLSDKVPGEPRRPNPRLSP